LSKWVRHVKCVLNNKHFKMSNSTANVLDLCGIKLINYLKKKMSDTFFLKLQKFEVKMTPIEPYKLILPLRKHNKLQK